MDIHYVNTAFTFFKRLFNLFSFFFAVSQSFVRRTFALYSAPNDFSLFPRFDKSAAKEHPVSVT